MTTAHIKEWQTIIGVKADGDFGPGTLEKSKVIYGIGHNGGPPLTAPPPVVQSGGVGIYPLQTEAAMTAFFGPPGGVSCTAGSADLPFPFPLAWDASQRVVKVSCHIKLEKPFEAIWAEAAKHYGEARFRLLKLDQFGGCYNFRKKRGGTTWSIHSWGAAWDVDPVRNPFGAGAQGATLDGLDFVPFWNIVKAQGAYSLGQRSNYDWQHFQFARFS